MERLFDFCAAWSFGVAGSTAPVCTTVPFVLQLIRVWQRDSARDIALTMFFAFQFRRCLLAGLWNWNWIEAIGSRQMMRLWCLQWRFSF
jgi:hypothetical protein